jgi:hypothetical protein
MYVTHSTFGATRLLGKTQPLSLLHVHSRFQNVTSVHAARNQEHGSSCITWLAFHFYCFSVRCCKDLFPRTICIGTFSQNKGFENKSL